MSVALLVGSVNAACVNFRPPPVPVAASVAGDAPTPVWTARTGRRFTGQLRLRDNMLYGGSLDRKIYAVDASNGEIEWSTRLPGMIVGGVLVSGDTIFAASSRPEGRILAVHRSTGKQIWRTGTHPVGAPLSLVDGYLIAQTQRGEILGVNPASGKVRWRTRAGVGRIAAVPAGPGALLVATTDSLVRLSSGDGRVIQRAASPGTVVSSWLAEDGALIAGTTDSLVISIEPENLGRNWAVRVDGPVLSSPAILGDTVFLATRQGTVYRIHLGEDQPRARRITSLDWPVTTPVSIIDRQLVLGGADGLLRALRTDGSEIWRIRIWRPVELAPVPVADGLVAVGGNGDLHRLRR